MNRPLRVVHLIHGYPPVVGGAERQLGGIAPLIVTRGLDVCVLTRRHPALANQEIRQNVAVERLPSPRPKPLASLSYTISALTRLINLRPDVIHAHELFSATLTAVIAKTLMDVPVVVTLHRSGPIGDVQRLRQKPFGRARMALFNRMVDTFVIISQEIRQELIGAGAPPTRLESIHLGVDTRQHHPVSAQQKNLLRETLHFPAGAPLVVFSGRLVPEKKAGDLLAIWQGVREACPGAVLCLLGEGTEKDRLVKEAGEGVRFEGKVTEVTRYLQAADLFVLPSSAEGLPMALLEALSCGLPALVTAVGGIPDLITHQQNGWLILPGDRQALLRGITGLLQDANLRARFSQAGRKTVMEHFALEETADLHCALYERLAAGRRKR